MTDLQVLTIALSVVLPVSMLILGNSRAAEPKNTMSAEISKEITAGVARISTEIESLRGELKIHELEHHHK
jgi:hypothetical protein